MTHYLDKYYLDIDDDIEEQTYTFNEKAPEEAFHHSIVVVVTSGGVPRPKECGKVVCGQANSTTSEFLLAPEEREYQ
jgi:hypothetical protein